MNQRLFENSICSDPKKKNSKKILFLLLSVLMHLAIIFWLYARFPELPVPASKPIKISPHSSLVFINPPPPPPPPPSLKRNIKKQDKPVEKTPEPVPAPIETPKEIKPEPPKEPEEAPAETISDKTQGEPFDPAQGKPEDEPGGVPGGIPGGVPGETGNNPSSETVVPNQNGPIRNNKPLKRTKYVAPVYPPHAIRARVEGTVIIEAIIGKDGKIKDAKVTRSAPLLDQAAIEAIKKWEYEPPIINGAPAELILTVTVNFVLK